MKPKIIVKNELITLAHTEELMYIVYSLFACMSIAYVQFEHTHTVSVAQIWVAVKLFPSENGVQIRYWICLYVVVWNIYRRLA